MVLAFGAFFIISLILVVALLIVFWILMLIDNLTRKFKNGSDKIVWILANIFLGILGALIYYFVIFKKDRYKKLRWFWWTLLFSFLALIFSFIAMIIVFSPKS